MQRTLLIAVALAMGTAVEMAARSASQSSGSLQLIALANAGVLVDDGRRSVVIDGAFRDGIPPYGTLPEAMRRQLEHAEGRFADKLWIEAPGSGFQPVRITQELLDDPVQVGLAALNGARLCAVAPITA